MTNNYEGSPQAYSVAIEHNVIAAQIWLVPMPDGVSLAADIYYPALGDARAPGMFPVILERTPYNKAAPAQVTTTIKHVARGRASTVLRASLLPGMRTARRLPCPRDTQ